MYYRCALHWSTGILITIALNRLNYLYFDKLGDIIDCEYSQARTHKRANEVLRNAGNTYPTIIYISIKLIFDGYIHYAQKH